AKRTVINGRLYVQRHSQYQYLGSVHFVLPTVQPWLCAALATKDYQVVGMVCLSLKFSLLQSRLTPA
ncbi:MAG: hypothetical protein LUP95_05040, partial [Euryarchaeota archaeon]|nr:hypothetical protein [Euryarchaeota archaeon]